MFVIPYFNAFYWDRCDGFWQNIHQRFTFLQDYKNIQLSLLKFDLACDLVMQ